MQGTVLAQGLAGLNVGAGLVERQASSSSQTWAGWMAGKGFGQTAVFGIRPHQSNILCILPPQVRGMVERGQGTGMKQPDLKIKISPTAPFTHPSLFLNRVWQAGVVLTVLWALHRPLSGLCSQGHWKVGKGESGWEMPKAGYLETSPGRKKEVARWEASEGWVIKQEWRRRIYGLSQTVAPWTGLSQTLGVASSVSCGMVRKNTSSFWWVLSHGSCTCANRL